MEAIGGRKFVLTLLVIAVGTAVQILSPHGVTAEFSALLIGAAATFGAANAFVTNKALQADAGAPVAPAADDEARAALRQMGSAIESLNLSLSQVQGVQVQQAKSIENTQKLARSVAAIQTGTPL